MADITYLDFDLLIDHIEKDRIESGYRARVINSPGGQASTKFSMPFNDTELRLFILEIGNRRSGKRSSRSSGGSPDLDLAKEFGGRLFHTVFNDEVRDCLRSSLNIAGRENKGLRIRLRLTDVPELADLPWEYLYNPSPINRFLALSIETPLVRYLEMPEEVRALPVTLPLRILVMISSPEGYDTLDVEREWRSLRESLNGLEQQGLVQLERLEQASLTALQRQLSRSGGYHIFHFIGHGGFDNGTGILLFEDAHGRGCEVDGQRLGTILRDCRSLRLALLNACEGGRAGRHDSFSGMAQSLIQAGISAVIAMQFEITDNVAIIFANEFYQALADGNSLDAALSEARKAIFTNKDNGLEWGTPVLYLRAPDGRIFDVAKRNLQIPISTTPKANQNPSTPVAPSNAIATADPNEASLTAISNRLSYGTMNVRDPLYITRKSDAIALDEIKESSEGVTITIKGPRQVGKSSLLMRLIEAADQMGKKPVFLDFQTISESDIATEDRFFRQFCSWITAELELEDKVDEYWQKNKNLGNIHRCTRYFRHYLLKEMNQSIVLAMDEVDIIFDAGYRSDFFGMLRAWHNNRAIPNDQTWKRLDFILVTSTEPYYFIDNLTQSPFNVGRVITLWDFTKEQVAKFNRQCKSPFPETELDKLMALLGGHPSLTRKAFSLVLSKQISIQDLFTQAANDSGPFARNLRDLLVRLQTKRSLLESFSQVIHYHTCPDEECFERLNGAGLVRREGKSVLPRCQLYADYFREHLHG
jgi:hypothetical protein